MNARDVKAMLAAGASLVQLYTGSVSYTHLDVYKRQAYEQSEEDTHADRTGLGRNVEDSEVLQRIDRNTRIGECENIKVKSCQTDRHRHLIPRKQ